MNQSRDIKYQDTPYNIPMQSFIQPTMKQYFPYPGQPAPYPYALPYQYPPPPPFFYFLNKSGFPQTPFNYEPEPVVSSYMMKREMEKNRKIQIIDADNVPVIKQEYIQMEKIKQSQPWVYLGQNKNCKKSEKIVKKVPVYNSEEQQVRACHLSQIFSKMLESLVKPSPNQAQIKKQVEAELLQKGQIQGKQAFFEELYLILKEKFDHFKKTKQQLIKYIIRRTYHNAKHKKNTPSFRFELEKLEQFHERNIRLHKSMNSQFLRKQFSNKVFLHFYEEFLQQVEDQFERENDEKTEKFGSVIANAWMTQDMSSIIYEKKAPWSYRYKLKIKTLAIELFKLRKSSPSENPFDNQ